MNASAELGRNPMSMHQIQPEHEDEQVGAGRDCRIRLAETNFRCEREQGQNHFCPVQLTPSRIDNLARLILTLAIRDDHT